MGPDVGERLDGRPNLVRAGYCPVLRVPIEGAGRPREFWQAATQPCAGAPIRAKAGPRWLGSPAGGGRFRTIMFRVRPNSHSPSPVGHRCTRALSARHFVLATNKIVACRFPPTLRRPEDEMEV